MVRPGLARVRRDGAVVFRDPADGVEAVVDVGLSKYSFNMFRHMCRIDEDTWFFGLYASNNYDLCDVVYYSDASRYSTERLVRRLNTVSGVWLVDNASYGDAGKFIAEKIGWLIDEAVRVGASFAYIWFDMVRKDGMYESRIVLLRIVDVFHVVRIGISNEIEHGVEARVNVSSIELH